MIDPIILLLGIYPKVMKSLSQRDICTLMFTVALFTIAKTQKDPKCPPPPWTLSSYGKKKGNFATYDNMDGLPGHDAN